MSDSLISSGTTVLLAIVSLAVVATLVSRNAQTGSVITAGGNAFSNALTAAEGPVTGGGGLSLNSLYSGAGFQTA